MDEGEGMEYLQPRRRLQDRRCKLLGINTIGGKTKPGTNPLSANGHHVAERVVQAGRLCLELNVLEKVRQDLVKNGIGNHEMRYLCKVKHFSFKGIILIFV
jgi:hypothetical protein